MLIDLYMSGKYKLDEADQPAPCHWAELNEGFDLMLQGRGEAGA